MDPHGADPPCIVHALASMDPNDAADRPCIVQALAASPSKPQALPAAARDHPTPPPPPPNPNDAAERPCIVQALAASPSKPQALPAAAGDHPTPPPRNSSRATSPRRTRSGGAPEWTAAETLALVATVAAVDDDGWARSVSAFQKWAIVADNLSSSGSSSSRRRGRAAVQGQPGGRVLPRGRRLRARGERALDAVRRRRVQPLPDCLPLPRLLLPSWRRHAAVPPTLVHLRRRGILVGLRFRSWIMPHCRSQRVADDASAAAAGTSCCYLELAIWNSSMLSPILQDYSA